MKVIIEILVLAIGVITAVGELTKVETNILRERMKL